MHFPHMEGFIGGFVGTMETPTCTGGETRSTHSYSCVDLGGGIGLCPPLSSATAILPMEEQREQVCCDPCAIPKVNLTLSYASFSFPDVARTATFNAATGTLVYSPVGTGEWSGCFGTFTETGGGSPASTAYVKWKLACDDFGATRLYFTLFTSSGCVGELATYNWSSVVDFTCEPLHLHLTMNVPELTGPTKFGDLYVDE
jgi:hypothetical protein